MLRQPGLVLLVCAALLVSAGGCLTLQHERRVTSLKVTSNPPGAAVWIEEAGVRRVIGTTPLTVEQPYEVMAQDFNERNWFGMLLPAAAVVLGGALMDGAKGLSSTEARQDMFWGGVSVLTIGAGSLLGLVIGFGVADGNEDELAIPSTVKVGGSLEGREPVEVLVPLGPVVEPVDLHLFQLRPAAKPASP